MDEKHFSSSLKKKGGEAFTDLTRNSLTGSKPLES